MSNLVQKEYEISRYNWYINFCKFFQKYSNFPTLKCKELSEEYRVIYKNIYGIGEEDVSKATFTIFSITCASLFLLLLFVISINILFIRFFFAFILSLFISALISYNFNLVLYRKIKKDEKYINALLYLIKINLSLMKESLKSNSELCIAFVKLIINYKINISDLFKKILNRIHIGYRPESELAKVITPSKDFNLFLQQLIIKNFDYNANEFDYFSESSSEKNFRVLTNALETKIGILFIIGMFFPIVLGFFVLFLNLDAITSIFILPFFLYLLHFLFKKLIKTDVVLIGLVNEYQSNERLKFEEFLTYLSGIALNLKYKYSPEKAFVKAYKDNSRYFSLLKLPLQYHLSHLISLQYTFKALINKLKYELKTPRYSIILDIILKMLEENAYYTSEKIVDIIKIIERHKRLEEKFEIILKGNKFTVLVFVFLFPIVLGVIGGMLPLLFAVVKGLENIDYISNVNSLSELILLTDIIVIFSILFLCNIITCYYFLKIIQYKRTTFILVISSFLFVIFFIPVFLISMTFF